MIKACLIWWDGNNKNIDEYDGETEGSIQATRDFVPAWFFFVDLRENQGSLFLQLNLTILKSDNLKDSAIKFEEVQYLRMIIAQRFLSICFISVQVTADPFYLSVQYYQDKEDLLLYISLHLIRPSVSYLLS